MALESLEYGARVKCTTFSHFYCLFSAFLYFKGVIYGTCSFFKGEVHF